MNNYEALIFDLDGTAIPNKPGGMPSERLIQAIADAKSRLTLCAATGRPISNAHPILEALSLESPCVIAAGTQIVDPKTSEILWEASLSPNDVNAILDICTPYHYEVLFRNELMGEGAPAAARDKVSKHVNVMYVMGCAQVDADVILAKIGQIEEVTAAGVISWTHEGVDIHITNRNATKEHAIAELLKIIGVSKEKSMGVGDADNDVHLFKGVGYKVAMGNATELLKSQADEVCDTVDNDGLAILIEETAHTA